MDNNMFTCPRMITINKWHIQLNISFTALKVFFFFFCGISGGAKQWTNKLFPGFPKRYGTGFSLFPNKVVRFVGSDVTVANGGVVEISEGEKAPRSYVWQDNKVAPHVLNFVDLLLQLKCVSFVMQCPLYLLLQRDALSNKFPIIPKA